MNKNAVVVNIGYRKLNTQETIFWKSTQILSPHWLILGSSGTGKTYRLKNIISQLATHDNIRIYVFDVAGDIILPSDISSTVKFSESTLYGINPLLLDEDRDSGGVRRNIRGFISMINRYSGRKLGERQQYAFNNLLLDFYAYNGFYPDKPESWQTDEKRMPTFTDFKNFAKKKIKSLVVGTSGKVHTVLNSLSGRLCSLEKECTKKEQNRVDDYIEKLKDDCKSSFCQFIDSIETGKEMDDFLFKYDSPDVLKSIYKRIEILYSLGVFKEKSPSFDRAKPVWRFDILSLSHEARGYLVELYLKKIFRNAKQAGLSASPRIFLILDESHLFLSEEPDHIINRLVRESRKYGVSVILSSQNFNDFNDIIASNCGSKIILGLDERYHEALARMYGIKPGRFRFIEPRRTAMVQLKVVDSDNNNRFVDVVLS